MRFTRLRDCAPVVVLKGNHDYLQKEQPFFEFLNEIPGVSFLSEPSTSADGKWVWVPHSREIPLPGLELVTKHTTHCFMHQTVTGAITSNGMKMESATPARLPHADTCKYYAGDIHVPQVVGDVEYVGSPYPVHFGDSYQPRMVILRGASGPVSDLLWNGIRRMTVEVRSVDDLKDLDVGKGDQVKVRVRLSRADLATWPEVRRDIYKAVQLMGVHLHGLELIPPKHRVQLRDDSGSTRRVDVSPTAVLARYARSRGIGDGILVFGEELMK